MELQSPADHAVVVVGAGPTGLMLAGELALAGVDVAVVERRVDRRLVGTRAGGLHARTLEVLDQRGIVDRFLNAGRIAQITGFAQIRLDISDFPTRHPYGVALWQNEIEKILADWVAEFGVPFHRDVDVTGVTQDGSGVTVDVRGGRGIRARYVVGCDGGRSAVRKSVGIDFVGSDPTMSYLLAEARLRPAAGEPPWGVRHDAIGVHALAEPVNDGPVRVMVTEQRLHTDRNPTLADLRAALHAAYGTDHGIHSPDWISRSTDASRQATAYRSGRVLIAGDAAHVHHPIGGQGLNTGVQDAVNLGWKLALVVRGAAPEALLDSYHTERHPVAERVLRHVSAQMLLLRHPDDPRAKALRDIVSELLACDEPRRRLAGTMSGLALAYDLGSPHPLVGRRMPDLELAVGETSTRVYALLHRGRAALINLGEPGAIVAPGWADRVEVVDAEYVGAWILPVLGEVDAPAAVLIRPDGCVAWVGGGDDTGLREALTAWFGPASANP